MYINLAIGINSTESISLAHGSMVKLKRYFNHSLFKKSFLETFRLINVNAAYLWSIDNIDGHLFLPSCIISSWLENEEEE